MLTQDSQGLDFYQFWIGGKEAPRAGASLWSAETCTRLQQEYYFRAMTTEGSEDLAQVVRARPQLELFSTPFLYTCFGLLPNRYDPAYTIYGVFEIIALVVSIFLIGRALRWPMAGILFLIAFVTLIFQPLKGDLRVGNVNEFQLLMIALYFAIRPRSALAAGVILGIATAFKPTVVFAIPLAAVYDFVKEGRWVAVRELGGVAIGGASAVAVSSFYFHSPRAWLSWVAAARALSRTVLPIDQGNMSILMSPGAGYIAAGILTVAAAYALVRSQAATPFFALTIGVLIYMLTAPLVWLHYILLTVPLAMMLLALPLTIVRTIAVMAMISMAVDPWDAFFPIRNEVVEARLIQLGLLLLAIGTMLALRVLRFPSWPLASSRSTREPSSRASRSSKTTASHFAAVRPV